MCLHHQAICHNQIASSVVISGFASSAAAFAFQLSLEPAAETWGPEMGPVTVVRGFHDVIELSWWVVSTPMKILVNQPTFC